jgi:hypothetical protein
MTKDEALKMAIEWAEGWYGYSPSKDALLKACRKALEQPAQEPYCWCFLDMLVDEEEAKSYEQDEDFKGAKAFPLYTHPHQWQGLTDDEIGDLITPYEYSVHPDLDGLSRAIEQALKDKNT